VREKVPDPPGAGVRLFLPASAALLLAVAAALPPETNPWSLAACEAIAAAAILFLVFGRNRSPRLPPAWALILLPLAALSILTAPGRARALDEAALAIVVVLAGSLGRGLADDRRGPKLLLATLAALGCAAALQAALQHAVTYPIQAEAVRAVDAADPTGLLVRLEAKRPSGPFTLPAALGGFLALSLPSLLVWAVRSARPAGRAVAAAALLLQGYALLLTRSLGALAACAVGLLLALPLLAPRGRALAALAILLLAILGGSHFLHARRAEMAAAPGGDPVSLRAGNWGAALRMVRDHPLFGTGPGSFGIFYPRYMREGMNETRHAHNSYLQAAAGWGLWILLPLLVLMVRFAQAVRDAWRGTGAGADLRAPALAGGGAFLFHNLGDFTLFLPGVAIPAALLLGLGIGRPGAEMAAAPRAAPGAPAARRAAALLMAAALAAHGVTTARSRTLLAGAREAAERGDLETAALQAQRSAAARPDDPDPAAFLAQMILAHRIEDDAWRAVGERAAERAASLEPESAILHYTLALYHQATGESAAAYRERHAAHLLYPLKRLYRADSPGPGEAPQ
jgi:O-antigen ligase